MHITGEFTGPPATGQLIVHYSPGAVPILSRTEYASRASLSLGRRWITLHDVDPEKAEEVEETYRQRSDVLFVETNHTVTYCFKPNDTYFPGNGMYNSSRSGLVDQWGLTRIDCPGAWEITKRRGSDVIVAIVDTGIDFTHPDLAARMLRDEKGRPVGYNSLNNSGDFKDDNGHGTHVSGIAAAVTDNSQGVSGVSFATARLMGIKALDAQGSGSDYSVAQGIVWAADHGAKVINCSLGSGFYSQTIQLAVGYAWTKGCMVIAAAGNDGQMKLNYPAACNTVLGIAATEKSGTTASYSNSGRHVDCAAPGSDYLSTMPTYPVYLNTKYNFKENYDALNGTSMATPVVSGLAALLWATYPEATNEQLRKLITQTASKLNGDGVGWLPSDGYGQVDASRAVRKQRSKSGVGCITGQVVNALSLPIGNVRVTAGNARYTTESDGMFRLANLPSGSDMPVSAVGTVSGTVKTVSMQVYVPDAADADVTMVMK